MSERDYQAKEECLRRLSEPEGDHELRTLLDLFTQPEELEKAKDEFDERTGGGGGGSKWLGPLLPPDFLPPVDLRWPEYVSTVRGVEWWIPTPNSDASLKL